VSFGEDSQCWVELHGVVVEVSLAVHSVFLLQLVIPWAPVSGFHGSSLPAGLLRVGLLRVAGRVGAGGSGCCLSPYFSDVGSRHASFNAPHQF